MPPRKENAKKTYTESQRARKNAYEQARKAKKNGPMEELRALTRHRFDSDFQPERVVIVEAAKYIEELRKLLADSEAAQEAPQMEMEDFDPEQAAYEMFGLSQLSNIAQSSSPPATVVPNTAMSSDAAYNQWNGYQEQYRMSPPWSIAESATPPTVFVSNNSTPPDGVYNGSASPPSVSNNTFTSSEAVYNQWNEYQEPQQYYYPPQVDLQQQQYNEYLMNGGQYY
ncbi:Protein CBG07911 [Caenorhabditis briggsae]|uniref:Uncharacterized protein n=3 Tax=Caenorhabditis briggsae TaxID=6238 RepID=A0AAE9DNQ3_CAEBR|nr:Protein CBG07911 [Caenorhabditis briggsae]ULU08309.1 hypothetical protein L3Y34_019457 [Caenorhabditis briggsae]CAP27838.1 Protein CBG07911 [Caenorhabditis briggsae]